MHKKIIKKFMSNKNKKIITNIINYFKLINLRFFSSSKFLSRIYYAIFSSEFIEEQHAVLSGKYSYYKGEGKILVLLRRNIHRVEKGLIMRPRKSSFGSAYISETVDAYVKCIDKAVGDTDEIVWASQVLHEYFTVVNIDDNINIKEASKMFSNCKLESVEYNAKKSVPYQRACSPEITFDYEQLGVLFQRRRSVRWFKDELVPEDTLRKSIRHASLAPSACNRQPFSFHTLLDSDCATELANFAMGTKGFSENIPAIIAVVGDLSSYPFERDRHVIYIDASLASMQLMLSLETLGLSSCPINWPDIPSRDKKINEYLNLKIHEKVVMLIAIGYADGTGMIPFSHKKSDKILLKIKIKGK